MEESRTEKALPLQERKQKLMNQVALQDFLEEWNSQSPTITVHTSGSTGTPKQLLVEKRRMLASARMTCDFLGLQPGDTAFLCMPMQYIAGKMMVVRSIERDLHLIVRAPACPSTSRYSGRTLWSHGSFTGMELATDSCRERANKEIPPTDYRWRFYQF